jgi:hypothetical protein
MIAERAPWCFLGADVEDPLLMGIDRRGGGDLHGALGLVLDSTRGRRAVQVWRQRARAITPE